MRIRDIYRPNPARDDLERFDRLMAPSPVERAVADALQRAMIEKTERAYLGDAQKQES